MTALDARENRRPWAAIHLGHLHGRCRACGWHIKDQGHADDCPTREPPDGGHPPAPTAP